MTTSGINTRILQGAGAGALYTATATIVGVLQLKVVLHFLSPAAAGLWTLFVTCGTYIALFDLGMMPTVGREISLLHASEKGERADAASFTGISGGRTAGGQVPNVLRTFTVCSRYVAGIAWVISLLGGLALLVCNRGQNHDVRTLLAWMLFSLGAAVNLLGSPAYAGLYGLGRLADDKLIRSVALLFGFLLTAWFLHLGWGMPGAALAWLLQGLLARLAAGWRLRRILSEDTGATPEVDWGLARRLLAPSVKYAGIQVASVAILQAANPVIALRIGTAFIPSYEAVSRIALTMMTLALLVASASTPFISMAWGSGDLATVRRLLSRNLRTCMALSIVPSAFVAVFGDQMVAVWLGPRVFPGFAVLWMLLAVVLLEVHHVVYASAVMATGKVVFVPTAVIASVMNLLLAFLLAPRLGLLGIAMAVCIAQLTTNNWYAPFRALRLFELSMRDSVRRLVLPCLVLLALQILLAFTLRRLTLSGLPGSSSQHVLLWLLIDLAACCVGGALLFPMLFLDHTERGVLSARLRQRMSAA